MNSNENILDNLFHRCSGPIHRIANDVKSATNNFGRGPNEREALFATAGAVVAISLLVFLKVSPLHFAVGMGLALIGKFASGVNYHHQLKFEIWSKTTTQRAAIALLASACLPVPLGALGASYILGWAVSEVAVFITNHPVRQSA